MVTSSQEPSVSAQPMRVLFLCTHNSSRSQMAEGLLRTRGGVDYEVFSAGTQPDEVYPLAIKVMRELGIDISSQWSKGIETFADQPPMDLVVTVCDEAAEACPFFPNARHQVHRGFPDPSRVTGSDEERLAAYHHVRDLIAVRINQFLGLHPSVSLEQLYPRDVHHQCVYLSRGKENSFFCPNTSGKLAKNGAHPPVSRPGNEAKPKSLALTEKSRQKPANRL